jgi:DNA modification methylase
MADLTLLYQSEINQLYVGDSLTYLQQRPTESVHLILTDPPYGVAYQSNTRTEKFDHIANDQPEDRAVVLDIMRECVRTVKQNRHLYSFGPPDVFQGLKVSEITELVWDKNTPASGDLTSPFSKQHEYIQFCTSKFRHAGQTGKSGLPNRVRKSSVLTFTRPTGRNVRHPTEKPVPLLRELIESSSKQSEIILDPFAGVGSTAVAATLLNRRAISIELNPEYAEIARQRIIQAEEAAAAAGKI